MSSEPRTILTVDDEDVVRTLLTKVLEAGGYSTRQANNGSDGLQIAQNEKIDLILQDVDMPGMNGHEVVGKLKADERTRTIPVIMLTGRARRSDKIEGLEAGADEYVTKPVSGSELLARVKALLRMKDLQDEVVRLERERLEQQLEFAREVQGELLPTEVPSVRGLDFAVCYRPCDAVGGDFYDFVPVGDQQAILVMGDAEGHGVSAALLMARAGAHVRSGIEVGRTAPAEMLHWINDLISADHGPDKLLPMVCASVDRGAGRLRYANAGHPPPVLLRAVGDEVVYLESTGPVLGLIEHEPFEEVGIPLGEGDVLACFTDGLNEATDRFDAEFGADRVLSIVRQHRHEDSATIAREVTSAWEDYLHGSPDDDLTLIIAKSLPDGLPV